MLTEIMELMDKFEAVFKTFKLDVVLSAIINLIIIAVLFKLTNLFMHKLKERAAKNDSYEAKVYLRDRFGIDLFPKEYKFIFFCKYNILYNELYNFFVENQ